MNLTWGCTRTGKTLRLQNAFVSPNGRGKWPYGEYLLTAAKEKPHATFSSRTTDGEPAERPAFAIAAGSFFAAVEHPANAPTAKIALYTSNFV
jgi:hypothetical protein